MNQVPAKDFIIPGTSEIIFENERLSFEDLIDCIRMISHALLCEKICNPVGIFLDRSPVQILAAVAALQINVPYVYLDPAYPEERINYILEDCQVDLMITEEKYCNRCLGQKMIVIENLGDYSEKKETNEAVSSEIGFILYTSGSTGVPKGVEIYRKSLLNFIDGMSEVINFSRGKAIASFTVATFDIFFLESVLSICKGLTVILANEHEQKNPRLMTNLIKNSKPDMLQFTPSRLLFLYKYDPDLLCLRHVSEILVGGEKLPLNLLQELQRKTNAKIYNMYGPTETTIWSTVSDLTNSDHIHIGTPIKNTSIYILDENSKKVGAGDIGEICISGDGLARGYIHKDELTARAFVNLNGNTRIYRTGDRGRYVENGNIEFLGRRDHQVKVRGHRIELEEIEIAMCSFENINQAVVICLNQQEESHLVGLYQCQKEIDENEFINDLQLRLPEYMIPGRMLKVLDFPHTSNGKIDRKEMINNFKTNAISSVIRSTSDNTFENKILDVFRNIMGENKNNELSLHSRLSDLGIDSITFVSIIVAFEAEFDMEFEDEKLVFKAFNTIEEIADYLKHRLSILPV
ncbi:non-ribosomal peptide synthetase [Paenibacillus etheri]|uniref:Carrier domain-containing protein n=1 Tax=Paenibacillus etheri TaxID=1306852 RepID=A0A0W1AZH2_9BACL|nr:amino acid adenylation domain-containing protein [Paenibacillus etheri]KTD86651.1 hypothetical protein UQ64_14435 [Paenibacillus etheri]